MKKVFLFGSGDGAKQYLLKHQKSFELIGLLDNDKDKHGTLFNNMIMIYEPSIVKTTLYDEIIIVSQWAGEIYTQLTEIFSVPPSKIIIPPKKEIKKVNRPFEDSKTRELARDIIQQLSFYAIKDNIALLVDFGTLLGLVRDNDIIEWDDDVDFSIINLPEEFNFSSWLSQVLSNINFPVTLIIDSKTVEGNTIYINLIFHEEENSYKNFITSISFRTFKNGFSLHLPSAGMWHAPEVHFKNYEIIQWKGYEILVPYAYKEYLTFLYGDWHIPKKDISMSDYANLGKVTYDDYEALGLHIKEIL